jgi:RimJ/RimL family protein N-acetyltransferase
MIKIRRVKTSDKKILLTWRNNPKIYKYAINPKPISLKDHEKWFKKVLLSSKVFFYIGELNGVPCGTVRYNLLGSKHEAEVSISVAPEFWKKGIATKLLKLSERNLKNTSQIKIIHATVLNNNLASKELFKKNKFKEYSTILTKEI